MSKFTKDKRRPNPFDSPDWSAFERHVRSSLVPKMKDSSTVLILSPKLGDADVQFAVQIGMCILLEKPLLVLAIEGRQIPPKLEQIADRIIYAKSATDPSINEQIGRFMTDFGKQ